MKALTLITPLLLAGALSACHDDNNDSTTTPVPETFSFAIHVSNLTNAQPFSPPAVILQGADFTAWQVGQAASVALEHLAEGGDASELLAAEAAQPNAVGEAPVGPGGSAVLELSTTDPAQLHLTVATMLVNTNDAFTGVTGLDLSSMQVGDTRVVLTSAYDAGTENNLELAGTIPGPADGGEGFNAARDDVTTSVTLHGGVVGADDGNPASVLNSVHRFDNPVMRIEVVRQ
ncbi:MAG: spondin domain-containing protein [bacterium]